MFRPTIIKVPLAIKWYHLEIHHPDGCTETVPFPYMGPDVQGSPYVDHAPNPRHVYLWACSMGYEVDDLSLELMIGRWEMECGADRYADMFEAGDAIRALASREGGGADE